MFVLGIESSCDETACAIVRDGKEVLANVISSQTDLHQSYGGVYPELAESIFGISETSAGSKTGEGGRFGKVAASHKIHTN